MTPMKPEVVLPTHAVQAWKHREFVAAQAAVLRVALEKPMFSAADVPEDVVRPESRQGVASNAWNSLRSLDIIERVPMATNHEELGIFGGRVRNGNGAAKGRWVAVYRLRSRALALAWLARNGSTVALAEPAAVQQEMAL